MKRILTIAMMLSFYTVSNVYSQDSSTTIDRSKISILGKAIPDRITYFSIFSGPSFGGDGDPVDFEGGIKLISQIEMGLQEFIDRLDRHSTIIFYYKFASLYFGAADFSRAVYWLNKIIY